MTTTTGVLVLLAAAAITAVLIVLLRPVLQRYALARPNARSLHSTPTPQGGGIAVLLAIFGWRKSHRLGFALSAFAAIILVGSVHLAWHYAVDGLAAIVIAFACWATAGAMTRRWLEFLEGRRASRPYIAVLPERDAPQGAAVLRQFQ